MRNNKVALTDINKIDRNERFLLQHASHMSQNQSVPASAFIPGGWPLLLGNQSVYIALKSFYKSCAKNLTDTEKEKLQYAIKLQQELEFDIKKHYRNLFISKIVSKFRSRFVSNIVKKILNFRKVGKVMNLLNSKKWIVPKNSDLSDNVFLDNGYQYQK